MAGPAAAGGNRILSTAEKYDIADRDGSKRGFSAAVRVTIGRQVDFMKQRITRELLPSRLGERTWTTWNYFALWIGMNVAVATYYVCESYMQLGLAVWQVVLCIVLGCLVLVFPMAANGHAGTKYGVPSPVYWRSACGYLGSNATAIIRAAVAVFYFGIHLYIGGQCVDVAIQIVFPAWTEIPISFAISFAAYWLLTVWVLTCGSNMLKKLESFTAPFLILWMVVLLIWARVNAGSWGTLISMPATISGTELYSQMLVCVTATIGWWATLVLNITDFTRYSRSQKAHIVGTAVGNPLGFAGLALVGALVTSCSAVIFGEAIWDPIVMTSKIDNPLFVVGMLLFLAAAEITTNTAANAYAPCMDISTVSGGRLSFKQAVWIFGIAALLTQPWKMMTSPDLYVDAFLVCSGGFLAPLAGVNISNYIFIRKTRLDLNALYDPNGEFAFKRLSRYNRPFAMILYAIAAVLAVLGLVCDPAYLSTTSAVGLSMRLTYFALAIFFVIFATLLVKWKDGGFNPVAFFTIAISVLCTFIGVYVPALSVLYNGAWFVATAVSIVLYYILMKKLDPDFGKAKESLELDEDRFEIV